MLRIPFVLLLNLLGIVRWALSNALYAFTRLFRRGRLVVEVELSGGYPLGRPRGFVRYLETDATFLELKRDIKLLRDDPDVEGILLKPSRASLGAARTAEVTALLDDLRDGGKQVVATGELFLTKDYLQATVADDIVLPPSGRLYTFAPRMESLFFGEALRRIGASAQVVHIGRYKTAANALVRSSLGAAPRRMMEEIRSGLERRWLERIASRRSLSPDAARRLFSSAPMGPRPATAMGFVDAEVFEADVPFWLAQRGAYRHEAQQVEETPYHVVTFADWLGGRPASLRWRPLLRRPRVIAVVDLNGMIIAPGMPVPGAQSVIDPSKVIPALRSLATSRRVAGVVLHVNSPGGSVVGSDAIWKAVRDLRNQKPVVAYCSDIAASGGYYIASAADRIVCHPETLTGSIGVVFMKVVAGDALARHGVHNDAVGDEAGSEFLSMFDPLGQDVLENVRDDARSAYRRFLQRVGQSRGLSKRRLHRYARGRVYLGDAAHQRGLVDALSGFEGAVAELVAMCREGGLELPDEPPLHYVAHRKVSMKDALRRSAIRAAAPLTEQLVEPLLVASLVKKESVLALSGWQIKMD